MVSSQLLVHGANPVNKFAKTDLTSLTSHQDSSLPKTRISLTNALGMVKRFRIFLHPSGFAQDPLGSELPRQ